MSRYPASDDQDHQPMMWLGGHAIFAAHFIVVVYVVSLFVSTAFLAFGAMAWSNWLSFHSDAVLGGQVWRVVTYGLVNPPSLGFVIDMFMIAWFGRELERTFGRRTFLLMYAGLYLLSPLLFTAIGIWQAMYLAGATGAFALFIAFATLHPNMPLLFNILAKWAAIVLVGIYTLIHLGSRDLAGLISLWATVGFAYGFVRHQQGHFSLPRLRLPRRQPKLRVLPGGRPAVERRAPEPDEASVEMDALLEKISRSGMASLTAKERERLQRSREELLRRKGRSDR